MDNISQSNLAVMFTFPEVRPEFRKAGSVGSTQVLFSPPADFCMVYALNFNFFADERRCAKFGCDPALVLF